MARTAAMIAIPSRPESCDRSGLRHHSCPRRAGINRKSAEHRRQDAAGPNRGEVTADILRPVGSDGNDWATAEVCMMQTTETMSASGSSPVNLGKVSVISGGASRYYNRTRTHLSLDKDAPLGRAIQRQGAIVAVIFVRTASSLRADVKWLGLSQQLLPFEVCVCRQHTPRLRGLEK